MPDTHIHVIYDLHQDLNNSFILNVRDVRQRQGLMRPLYSLYLLDYYLSYTLL